MSLLRHFLILILVGIFAIEKVKAYSITVQSVTCNLLKASITLESWEYVQGSYIQLYPSIQSSANAWLFQAGITGLFTSTSLTNTVTFINNRQSVFAGRSSVAIGIANSSGNLLPYQGTGDPDIATISFSTPQGCSSSIPTTTPTITSTYFSTSSSSISTTTITSILYPSSITSPVGLYTTSSSSPFSYPTYPPYHHEIEKKTNTGAIAGGVVGGVVILILLTILAYCCIRRRKKNHQDDSNFSSKGFTTTTTSLRGSQFAAAGAAAEFDIEKDLNKSTISPDQSTEECQVNVLGRDAILEPVNHQEDPTSNQDGNFVNQTLPAENISKEDRRSENRHTVDNPLLMPLDNYKRT